MAQREWRNRIVRYAEVDPADLLANPNNFRVHPKHQQAALTGLINEVGYLDPVLVQDGTDMVIDGHLRVSLAMRDGITSIPVQYVDLTDAEANLALASFDPISALATADADKLRDLLEDVSTGDAALMQMISDMAEREGVIAGEKFDPSAEWGGMPEFDQDDKRPVKRLIVSFLTPEAVQQFAALIGQQITMSTDGVYFPAIARESRIGVAYLSDDEDAA